MAVFFELSVYFLVLFLVLVKGGTETTFSMMWSAGAFMLFCVWAVRFPLTKVFYFLVEKGRKQITGLHFFTLFIFWQLLQLVCGISQDVQVTINQLILSIALLVFLLPFRFIFIEQINKKRLFFFLAALGAIQAIYGLYIYLTQTNKIVWIEKVFYLDKPTGTLVNANHYGAYLALILVLVSSYLICRLSPVLIKQKNEPRSFYFRLVGQLTNPLCIVWLLLLVTIFTTRSVGAIGSLMMVFMVFIATLYLRETPKRYIVILFVFMALSLIGILLLAQSEVIFKEWQGLDYTFKRRLNLSITSFYMALDNWLLGVGGGAFYSTFSQYRNLSIGNSYYNFAHNDFLQFWIEYGVIGVALLVGMVGQCLRVNFSVLRNSNNFYRHVFAYTSIYGTLMLAIHSLVDFPLQVPAYALLYLMILFFNPLTWTKQRSRQKNRNHFSFTGMKNTKYDFVSQSQVKNVCALLFVAISFVLLFLGKQTDLNMPKLFLFKAAYFPLVVCFLIFTLIAHICFLRNKFGVVCLAITFLVLVPTVLPNLQKNDVIPDDKAYSFTLASFSAMTRSRNAHDIKKFIIEHQPDVLCLQEVTHEDEIKIAGLYPYSHRYDGNKLVLSRFNIAPANNKGPIQLLELDFEGVLGRNSQFIRKVALLNMHMPRQYRDGELIDKVSLDLIEKTENKQAIIMCGDFNMTPKNSAYENITKQLGFKDAQMNQTWSYGATFPNGNRNLAKLGAWLRIDYIFYKGLLSADTRVINVSDLSDHKAVMTTFYSQ